MARSPNPEPLENLISDTAYTRAKHGDARHKIYETILHRLGESLFHESPIDFSFFDSDFKRKAHFSRVYEIYQKLQKYLFAENDEELGKFKDLYFQLARESIIALQGLEK